MDESHCPPAALWRGAIGRGGAGAAPDFFGAGKNRRRRVPRAGRKPHVCLDGRVWAAGAGAGAFRPRRMALQVHVGRGDDFIHPAVGAGANFAASARAGLAALANRGGVRGGAGRPGCGGNQHRRAALERTRKANPLSRRRDCRLRRIPMARAPSPIPPAFCGGRQAHCVAGFVLRPVAPFGDIGRGLGGFFQNGRRRRTSPPPAA